MKIENVKIEKNNWSVEVDNEIIKVENTRNKLNLFVNDKLQDAFLGSFTFHNIRLSGKTTKNREIKVVCGGDFKMHCCIFVDNELVLDSKK